MSSTFLIGDASGSAVSMAVEALLHRIRRALPAPLGLVLLERFEVVADRPPELPTLGERLLVLVGHLRLATRHDRLPYLRCSIIGLSSILPLPFRITTPDTENVNRLVGSTQYRLIRRSFDRVRVRSVPDRTASSVVSIAMAETPLHRQLGMTDDELAAVIDELGREPTHLELAMYSVMWSEHCSYKSSRPHLGRFPTEAPWVLVGPGEGAGVIDVGDGVAVAVRIESHNHPSAVEPYQGAATGVGGIIRDIFSMGARPIALMDPLRFGPLDDPRTRYLFEGVVSGISGYGNAVGVPTVGGELVFDECYRDNPLVNVFCLGTLPDRPARARPGRGRRQPRGAARRVHRARRHRRRQRARVGRVRGGQRGQAAVGAGRRPVRGEEAHRGVPRAARRRPRDRRAGPRRGRHLVRGVGDRGQDRRGHGRRRRPGAAPRAGHEPGRDAHVREPGADARDRHARSTSTRSSRCASAGRSGRRSIGRVTDTGRFRVYDGLFDAIGVPGREPGTADRRRAARGVVGPHADRRRADRQPRRRSRVPPPARAARRPRRAPRARSRRRARARGSPPGPTSAAELLALLGSPNIADPSWVYRQYDHQLFLNTVVGPGGDASVLRLRDAPPQALALSVDGNARFCALEPRTGGRLAVLEAARNVACTGARAEGARELPELRQPRAPRGDVAVLRGRRRHERGVRRARPPGHRRQRELLQREPRRRHRPDAGRRRHRADRRARPTCRRRRGSATATRSWCSARPGPSSAARRGRRCTACATARRPPPTSTVAVRAARRSSPRWSPSGSRRGVHDCSDGGLAVALAEMAIHGGVGFEVEIGDAVACFSESTSRVVLSVAPDRVDAVIGRAAAAGVPVAVVGTRRRRRGSWPRARSRSTSPPRRTPTATRSPRSWARSGSDRASRRPVRVAVRRRGSAILVAMLTADSTGPSIGHACGVFGVYAPGQSVAHLTYLGLFALQHRGPGVGRDRGERRRDHHGDEGHGSRHPGLRRAPARVARRATSRSATTATRPPGRRRGRTRSRSTARSATPASRSATTATSRTPPSSRRRSACSRG